MLIGVFYSGIGISLLRKFSAADPACDRIRCALVVSGSRTDKNFTKAGAILAQYTPVIRDLDLPELNRFLSQNKPLVLSLLENPYLIEHDTFTELMQVLFHATGKLWRIFRIRIMRICPGI